MIQKAKNIKTKNIYYMNEIPIGNGNEKEKKERKKNEARVLMALMAMIEAPFIYANLYVIINNIFLFTRNKW